MSDHINQQGWIIGAGHIAQEYAKILTNLGVKFITIGRSEDGVHSFKQATGLHAEHGGLKKFLATKPATPDFAIVAVSVDQLSATALDLMDFGVDKILLEKPGFLNPDEMPEILKKARGRDVRIAYNRRFLSSVITAQKIVKEDGGITSFRFDFTEWPSRILSFTQPEGVLENWFFLNSTHVVDMAFYLGGWPKELSCFCEGELPWHKPAIFSGAGRTEKNIPFSYIANWTSAGRWYVEISTSKRKLIFCPLEELKQQPLNDVNIYDVEIDNSHDKAYKPGFYAQTIDFLNERPSLPRLEEQAAHLEVFKKMAGRATK